MNKLRIKSKDTVMVISGKDSGKTGTVDQVYLSSRKTVVLGINIQKKHLKPTKKTPQGGILDFPGKIDISNLMLVCPNCQKMTRVAYKINDKQKIRVCRKCKESVEGAKS